MGFFSFPIHVLKRMTRLQKLMTMLVIFAIVLSVVFGAIFVALNRQNIYQTVGMEMEYDTRRVSIYMNVQMDNIQSVFDELLSDTFLQKYVSDIFETDPYSLMDFNQRLQSMAERNSFIDTVDVYIAKTGQLFTSDYGPTVHLDSRTKDYFLKSMRDSLGLQITRDYRKNLYYYLNRNQNHITFTFPIYGTYIGRSEKIGLAAISVRESTLLDLLGNSDGRRRLLLDEDGTVFFTNGIKEDSYPIQGEIFAAEISCDSGTTRQKIYGERHLVASTKIDYTGWTLVVMTPLAAISHVDTIGDYALLLILLNVALLLLAEILIVRNLSRQIQPLMEMMENVKQGDFQTSPSKDESDEFSYLFRSFRSMQQRVQQQFDEIYHLSLLQKEANFKLMHAQIKPHFIYNIFNNMNWLIQLERYERLADLTDAVAVYFKKSLNNGKPYISIRDEAKLLESYIDIQHIRFGDRFQARVEMQQEIMDIRILNHLLQPLVENAINHGLEPLTKQGNLIVRGFLQGELLIFEIEDDGVGMKLETLLDIRSTLAKAQADVGNYFALNNVHQRIRILYGEEYGLQIFSTVGKGTLIRVLLPKTPPKKGISAGMGLE